MGTSLGVEKIDTITIPATSQVAIPLDSYQYRGGELVFEFQGDNAQDLLLVKDGETEGLIIEAGGKVAYGSFDVLQSAAPLYIYNPSGSSDNVTCLQRRLR